MFIVVKYILKTSETFNRYIEGFFSNNEITINTQKILLNLFLVFGEKACI